jgi:hypothetical protein
LQDHLWDVVKRDRLVWAGDMHPASMVVNAVFGELAVVRESLDFIRDEAPPTEWMNGIAAYSIWWLLIHRGWYIHQGNLEFLEQQRSYLQGLVDLLISMIDTEGREALDGWRFLDRARAATTTRSTPGCRRCSCWDCRQVPPGFHATMVRTAPARATGGGAGRARAGGRRGTAPARAMAGAKGDVVLVGGTTDRGPTLTALTGDGKIHWSVSLEGDLPGFASLEVSTDGRWAGMAIRVGPG